LNETADRSETEPRDNHAMMGPTDESVSERQPLGLKALTCLLILAPQCLKVATTLSPLPRWELDPMLVPADFLGLGPAGAGVLDVLTMLGGAMALLLFRAAKGPTLSRAAAVATTLLCVASAAVAVLWVVRQYGLLSDQRIAVAYIAGFLGAAGVLRVGRDARIRRLAAGILLGVLVMIAAKGSLQMLLEHPRLVESYQRDKSAILSAQGWADDSVSAKGYERRLMQNEPTGWFGLANVFATFMAAGAAMCVPPVLSGFVRRRDTPTALEDEDSELGAGGGAARWMWAGLLIIMLAGTIAAGSKGGFAVLLSCVVLAGTGWWLGSRRGHAEANAQATGSFSRRAGAFGGACAVLLILGANAAVAARGAFGERIGELSLLFRWFYIEAAARIFRSAPLTGVGPDGFKESYLLLKNPLSPEEVQSPHCINWDWLATLGSVGLLLIGASLLLAWLCGKAMFGGSRDVTTSSSPQRGPDADSQAWLLSRAAWAVPLVVTFGTLWLERAALPPEQILMRIGGLVAAGLIGVVIARQTSQRATVALSAGCGAFGLALLLQSQIEVTMASSHAGPLAMIGLGLGAAAVAYPSSASSAAETTASTTPSKTRPDRLSLATGMAAIVVTVTCAASCLPGLVRWEGALQRGAEALRPLAESEQILAAARGATSATQRDELLRQVADVLTAATGRPVAAKPQAVEQAVAALRRPAVSVARESLAEAMATSRPELSTWREWSRLSIMLAQLELASPKGSAPVPAPTPGIGVLTESPEPAPRTSEVRRLIVEGTTAPDRLVRLRPASVANWQVTALRTAVSMMPDRQLEHALLATVNNALHADPYNLQMAVTLYRIYAGQKPVFIDAANAARRALEINALQRLDAEVRSLDAATKAELERMVRAFDETGEPPPAHPR
jgi:hypothetical protein